MFLVVRMPTCCCLGGRF